MSNQLFKFELPTLYARAKTGAVLVWNIEVNGNKYRMINSQEGGKQNASKWSIAEAKNVGQSNETTAEEQAEAEATSKWMKKLKLVE